MSYAIYFIKKKDLSLENIGSVLETTDPKPDNEIFLSKDFNKSLIGALESLGLKFETFEGKHFELNFPSYQVSMFDSQIAISLPYWDANAAYTINQEVKQISNVFLTNGLTGFDPQTGEFILEEYEVQPAFVETKTSIEKHLKLPSQQQSSNSLKYLGLGLGIILLSFFIWKMINR